MKHNIKKADRWKLSPYVKQDGNRGCNEYVKKDFSSESSQNGFCEYILSSPYILNKITGVTDHDFRKNIFFIEAKSHEFNDDYLISCTFDYSNNVIIISLNGKEMYLKYKKTCRSWAQARKYIIDLINILEQMKKNPSDTNVKLAKKLIKLAKSLMSAQEMIEIDTKQCPFCKSKSKVKVYPSHLEAWENGELIQRALPELNADEREMLKTGICTKCWDEIFSEHK